MIAMELSVTFIDRDGSKADEVVDATNNGTDIMLSAADGAVKLVLSTAQVAELLAGEDRRKAA